MQEIMDKFVTLICAAMIIIPVAFAVWASSNGYDKRMEAQKQFYDKHK